MKVHFACSSSGIKEYKKVYSEIQQTIRELGHTITRDWLDEADAYLKDKKRNPVDWKKVFSATYSSIMAADVAIFENTVSSFSIGYQLSLALERRKPVLMLFSKEGNRQHNDNFAAGIDSDLITMSPYDLGDLKQIIQDFIVQNSRGGEKVRFNFFIDKNLENYLDWASFNYKKSKSDIIRELLADKMIREDSAYRKYLKPQE